MSQAESNQQTNANDDRASDSRSTWDELRAVIQGRWSELTHDDLENLKGRVDRLVNLVQERYSLSVEDARRQVNEFEKTLEQKSAELYGNFSTKVGTKYRNARQNVSEFRDDVRNFGFGTTVVDLARHYPVATIAASFLLGALVAGGTVRSRPRRWY